ncbi:hypothetical protein JessAGP_019 [Caulobacter phage Jess A]|nr:hypothetical protein JessAGP_019 [Caulobacter phage Jess A]WCA46428.1 hypothetical protein [Caulobacter phage RapA]
MDIHINTLADAESAVFSVFGDDISVGPRISPTPKTIHDLITGWPGHKDDVLTMALQLPWDFDISKPLAANERKAVVVRGHLVNIICGGQLIGLALRVDEPSIGSIEAWISSHQTYIRKIRQAH